MMIRRQKANIEEISKIMPVYCFDAKYNKDIKKTKHYQVITTGMTYKKIKRERVNEKFVFHIRM